MSDSPFPSPPDDGVDRGVLSLDTSTKDEVLLEKIRGLMNGISPENKEDTINAFLSYDISSNDILRVHPFADTNTLIEIAAIIVNCATEKPKIASLYAEVCERQVRSELLVNPKISPFRNALLNYLQSRFCERDHDHKIDEVVKKQIQHSEDKLPKWKSRAVMFLALTYNYGLISLNVLLWCLDDLFHPYNPIGGHVPQPPYDEDSLQCAALMMEIVVRHLVWSPGNSSYHPLEVMKRLAPGCSIETRCMFVSLAMAQNKDWVKGNHQLPRTVASIQKELEQVGRPSKEADILNKMLKDYSISLDDLQNYKECNASEEADKKVEAEVSEVEPQFQLSPWMIEEKEQIEQSIEAMRNKTVSIYNAIVVFENSEETDESRRAKTTMMDLLQTVSSSILQSNKGKVEAIEDCLLLTSEETGSGGRMAKIEESLENAQPIAWMNEVMDLLDSSVGQLRDKTLLLYKDIIEMEGVLAACESPCCCSYPEMLSKEIARVKECCQHILGDNRSC